MTAIAVEIDKTDCFNGLYLKRPVNANVNTPRPIDNNPQKRILSNNPELDVKFKLSNG